MWLAVALVIAIAVAAALRAGSEDDVLRWTFAEQRNGEGTRTLRVSRPVSLLAADGSLTAVAAGDRSHNVEILTWDVRSNRVGRIEPFLPSDDAGRELAELAVAGDQVAWIFSHWAFRSFDASILVVSGRPIHGVDRLLFEEMRNLHGQNGLLFFNTWRTVASERRSPALWRASGGDVARLRSDRFTADVLDVDGGRALLAHADGVLEVIDARSATVREIHPVTRLADPVLAGLQVTGLSAGGLATYDVRTGAKVGTTAITAGSSSAVRLEDVEEGVAVYVAEGAIHLQCLADGRSFRVRVSGTPADLSARLTAEGLFYAYNSPNGSGGALVFVPADEVARSLGGRAARGDCAAPSSP